MQRCTDFLQRHAVCSLRHTQPKSGSTCPQAQTFFLVVRKPCIVQLHTKGLSGPRCWVQLSFNFCAQTMCPSKHPV